MKKQNPKAKQEKLDQITQFKRVARELECNESEAVFDAALKRIGKAKVESPAAKKVRPKP